MFDDFSDDNLGDTPISQVMFEDQIDDFGDDVSCKIESYVKNIVPKGRRAWNVRLRNSPISKSANRKKYKRKRHFGLI